MKKPERIFTFDCEKCLNDIGTVMGKCINWFLVALIFAMVFKMCGF